MSSNHAHVSVTDFNGHRLDCVEIFHPFDDEGTKNTLALRDRVFLDLRARHGSDVYIFTNWHDSVHDPEPPEMKQWRGCRRAF